MTDQTQTPCLNPDCDDLAAPGFSVCRWESCEAYALLDEQGGWLVVHRDGWTQHTTDEGTAIDLTLPLVGEDRTAAERLVRHHAHRNPAGPRAGVIDEDFASAVRCGHASRAANVQRRVAVLEASYARLRQSLGDVGVVGVHTAVVAVPCRNHVGPSDDDGPTSR